MQMHSSNEKIIKQSNQLTKDTIEFVFENCESIVFDLCDVSIFGYSSYSKTISHKKEEHCCNTFNVKFNDNIEPLSENLFSKLDWKKRMSINDITSVHVTYAHGLSNDYAYYLNWHDDYDLYNSSQFTDYQTFENNEFKHHDKVNLFDIVELYGIDSDLISSKFDENNLHEVTSLSKDIFMKIVKNFIKQYKENTLVHADEMSFQFKLLQQRLKYK